MPRTTKTRKDNFFIGYQKTPDRDRRFLLTAIPLLILAGGGFSYFFSRYQTSPPAARWSKRTVTLVGQLIKEPYPYLLVPNNYATYGYDVVFLVRQGKYGSQSLVRNIPASYVEVTGKILTRDDSPNTYLMETLDIEKHKNNIIVSSQTEKDYGSYRLSGCIIDSKCHYGVMRPAEGITHKACASLCLRGGIPPFFLPDCKNTNKIFLVTDEYGKANPQDFLSYVLDAISVEGRVVAINNYIQFRIQPTSIQLLRPSLHHPHAPS